EDVHRREVAVEHLPAVQLAEDLEDADDRAARGPLRPALARLLEVRAEVAVLRVLEDEAVEHAAVDADQRERVEDADRVRVAVEEASEVRLAHPAVDVLARLHRDERRDRAGVGDAAREVGLPEAALAEQALDPVLEARLRARDDLLRQEERRA